MIHDVASPEALNASALDWYNIVHKDGLKAGGGLAGQGSCWVDVRDLAEVHALALTTEAAAGERTIISAGTPKPLFGYVVDFSRSHVRPVRLARLGYVSYSPIVLSTPGLKRVFKTVNIANSLSPNPIPRGETKDFSPIYRIQYDTTKAARIFGLKYRTREEVTRDILADIERRGW